VARDNSSSHVDDLPGENNDVPIAPRRACTHHIDIPGKPYILSTGLKHIMTEYLDVSASAQ
jgi:hypothetical protein